jgi:hypothetical protein
VGTQVCFTAEENLVAAIDEIAAKIGRSKSDTLNTLLWLAVQNMRAQPKDFGDLLQSVSAGTATVTPVTFHVTKEFKIAGPAATLSTEDQTTLQKLQKAWRAQLEKNYAQGARQNTVEYLIGKDQRLFYVIRELESQSRKKVKLSFGPAYSEMGDEWSKDFLAIDEMLRPVRLHVQWQVSSRGTSIDAQVEQVDPRAYGLDGDKAIILIKRVIGGEA